MHQLCLGLACGAGGSGLGWAAAAAELRRKLGCRPAATPVHASIFPRACREFVSALYDWHNTAPGRLNVTVWVNDTNIGGGQANGAQGPPEVQRWGAPVNLAGGWRAEG